MRWFALLDTEGLMPLGEYEDFNSADEVAPGNTVWLWNEDALRRLRDNAVTALGEATKTPNTTEVTPAFTYEVEAVMETEDGVTRCNESDADYWGVYERPTTPDEYGHCLAVWIADFARRADAENFAKQMEESHV